MLRSLYSSLGPLILGLVPAVHSFSSEPFQVIERLTSIPDGWTQGPAPDKSMTLRFRLAVHQENEDSFYKRVLDISTPGSPLYGMHMGREEVKDFLRPPSDVSAQLLSWLTSRGVPSDNIKDDGSWISFHTTVEQAERLLNTSFYYFIDEESKDSRIRTLKYSAPSSIAPNVRMIQPTTMFARLQPQRSTITKVGKLPIKTFSDDVPQDCDPSYVVPSCLRELYGFSNYTIPPGNSDTLGVSGFLKQYAQYDDLESFLTSIDGRSIALNFSVHSINGGVNPQGGEENSFEANLDVQYAVSLSNTSLVTFFTTAGLGKLVPDLDQPDPNNYETEPYLEQVLHFLDLPQHELPTVLSTSYGENEQNIPEPYAKSVCSLFAQLGARGVSLIFSSGDTGVGSACQSNDGTNRTIFNPTFPSGCPFVTSVGATVNFDPESAADFSSGGFSNFFERPSYQEQAVKKYLSMLGDKWAGMYNPGGRAFPDVAAQGENFAVIDKGGEALVTGTSASTPVFAAIVYLLNTARGSQGQPPLGFLNPWLYSSGYQGLTDIVRGGSNGCTGKSIYSGLDTPFVPYASWNATPGWDPVTGLGTPYFPRLVQHLP
ncbi:hypothetical protein ACJ72_00774 [Emergomyces africanus]|uniref:tripeptidyl-peptidase II n=1 Tax=Emergomyces africanus TaxID=1955775 RepID=A0A1B7P728_9EURO|nr:hypothetical protein ACJ72_00774 [Emergomyces africanus]